MESADLLRGVGGKPRVKYSTKNILSSGRRDGALYFHRSSTAIASGLPERLLMSSSNRTR
jgi:hypothetical protein